MNTRVMIVDDEPALMRVFVRALCHHGVDAVGMTDPSAALAAMRAAPFAVLVTDLSMPSLSGVELVRAVRGAGLAPAVVVMSGSFGQDTERHAAELGAVAWLEKPVKMARLIEVVRAALGATPERGLLSSG